MAVRYGLDETLAAPASAIASGHVGGRPSLIDEDQLDRIKRGLLAAPSRPRRRYVRPILFGGMLCLFLRVSPWATRKLAKADRPI